MSLGSINVGGDPRPPRAAEPLSERQPLLARTTNADSSTTEEGVLSSSDHSFPWTQLLLVSLTRFAEATTFTVAIPFLPFMLEDLGISPDPALTGRYAGIVEGLFPLSEFLCLSMWHKRSERVGRRPVFIQALAAVSIGTPLFGFSTRLWQMCACRIIAGGGNPNIVLAKVIATELTTPDQRALAYSLDPIAWSIGALFGPVLGGLLSRPCDRWPSIFGPPDGDSIWARHEYFLPCLAAGLVPTLVGIVVSLKLEETHPRLRSSTLARPSDETNDIIDRPDPETPKYSLRTVLHGIRLRLMIVLALFSFVSLGNYILLPLHAYEPARLGGLGMSIAEIGLTQTAAGFASMILIQLIVFPYLARTVDPKKLLPMQMFMILVTVAIWYGLSHIAAQPNSHKRVLFGICVVLVARSCTGSAFATITLLFNQICSSSSEFGYVNVIASALPCLVRGIAPPIVTVLFAQAVEHQVLYLVFLALFVGGLMCFVGSLSLSTGRRVRTWEGERAAV